MSRSFQKAWLVFVGLAIAAFGPVCFLGILPATQGPAAFTLDLLSWPIDGAPDLAAPGTRFLLALTGGFLMGWGVLIAGLALRLHDQAPDAVRGAVLWSLCAWCALDSAGSIAGGHASNALFNLALLALLAGPLWLSKRQ